MLAVMGTRTTVLLVPRTRANLIEAPANQINAAIMFICHDLFEERDMVTSITNYFEFFCPPFLSFWLRFKSKSCRNQLPIALPMSLAETLYDEYTDDTPPAWLDVIFVSAVTLIHVVYLSRFAGLSLWQHCQKYMYSPQPSRWATSTPPSSTMSTPSNRRPSCTSSPILKPTIKPRFPSKRSSLRATTRAFGRSSL